ncbi:MAG: hypothetical protein ABI627_28955 [Polyangiaceae bacterium]
MFGTVRVMVFFVIELKSRAVHIAGMRVDPDGAWMTQVARNLLDPADGFLRDATHLIHDRGPVCGIAKVCRSTTKPVLNPAALENGNDCDVM